MEPLMPSTAKGKHAFCPGSASNVSSSKLLPKKGKAAATVIARGATPSSMSGGPIASSSHTVEDLNLITPSTPSTFLSGAVSSNGSKVSSIVTSVSRQKHKSVISGPDSVMGSDHSSGCKRARPLSATVQAQVDASKVIQKLSAAFQNIYQEIDGEHKVTTALPPVPVHTQPQAPGTSGSDDITRRAALALAELPLNPDDMNDLAEYMLDKKNKSSVLFFLAFPPDACKSWVEKRLREIHANGSQK
ncbi:hypothetical protein JVU11DRAFT_1092 [Chiua virens]|nr:hypothetical protein JVU11DRAFT_1092 [Chiua virens]